MNKEGLLTASSSLVVGILTALVVLLELTSAASANVESGSDGESMHVRKHERQTIRYVPAPSPETSTRGGQSSSSGRSQASQDGESNERSTSYEPPRCLNRSEIFSAMTQGRECDPSIPPFAM